MPTSYTLFFINSTFVSNARLKLAKIKQKVSNTLRLNFCFLKIARFLHPSYHSKRDILGGILKKRR